VKVNPSSGDCSRPRDVAEERGEYPPPLNVDCGAAWWVWWGTMEVDQLWITNWSRLKFAHGQLVATE
jgi:hypothetical protein